MRDKLYIDFKYNCVEKEEECLTERHSTQNGYIHLGTRRIKCKD